MRRKKKLVILTGAGISAESGLQTFRDSHGLWERYRIEDVATPGAWARNPELVLEFYNQRRRDVIVAQPNAAHCALPELENYFDVTLITQNIDDLHERAGSHFIIHLHGEILKSQSSIHPSLRYECRGDLALGDLCELGSQLRPHIVWFEEAVPMMEPAIEAASQAEIFLVIGTSLQVYPAASLLNYAPDDSQKFLVDPNAVTSAGIKNIEYTRKKATEGVPELVKKLIKELKEE
jgi:NAD-dependent deacetylase